MKDVGVENKKIAFKSSKKPIYGFIKAKILPSLDKDPFLPIRLKNGKSEDVILTKCWECAFKKLQTPCQHPPDKRAVVISTTIPCLNYCLENNLCSVVNFFEIWVGFTT